MILYPSPNLVMGKISTKHPKLIDYRKEFSQEDIQKLIG